MNLSKQELLSELSLKREPVELANGTIFVSEISALDYIKLWTESSVESDELDESGSPKMVVEMQKFTPALLVYSIVDESGNRMFTEADVETLSRSSQAPFMKIAEAAKRINGLTSEEGNVSEPTPDGSNSGE